MISSTIAGILLLKVTSIPLKERLNVKGVISDAYKAYLTMPEEFFPNAITILDSFHVVKVIISQMNAYIYKVMKKYKSSAL